MNILSVDYGKKRIGLALLDTDIGVVLPFGVVEGADMGAAVRELLTIIKNSRADRVLVGLPRELSGADGEMAARVRAFAGEFESAIAPIPILFADERFSSAQADRMQGDLGNGMGASRDERAAMVLLEAYAETLL